MKQIKIKFLTYLLFIMMSPAIFAGVITIESAKSHLRLKISVPKDLLTINKNGKSITIKSLNADVFKKVADDLAELSTVGNYIKKMIIDPNSKETAVKSLTLELTREDIELFTFYKDRDKNYVLDFWSDSDSLLSAEKKEIAKILKQKDVEAPTVDKPNAKAPILLKRPSLVKKVIKNKKKKVVVKKINKAYRDFRYGASSIWDYEPLSPKVKNILNLERKTPEHFFPIRDRKYSKNDKEAHLQLAINLYRKKKWGLMYKSITLFYEKYGDDDHIELLEYLKANSILRENIDKGNRKPVKTAIAMLTTIAKRTKNYEMKKGILKYLITFKLSANDYVKSLDYAKMFYVSSKENFDYEESGFAAETILFSLTQLRQVEKLREVIKDKTLKKLVSAQTMLAYEIYTLIKIGKISNAIKLYEKNLKSIIQPANPTILFNVAEALFREARYKEAIRLFDQFLSNYSYITKSSAARLRIALCYEILDKDIKQTSDLYKNAINKSQDEKISYEARLRYVALRSVRKKKLTKDDREIRILLETDDLKLKRNKNLKKLLWLVRIRTLLADKEYKKALTYLNAIPLNILSKTERRVLEGDGAEAIYGIMLDDFKKGEYSRVIRVWDVYKEKYVRKVATDAYLNFIVGKSYIRTGLYNGFDEVYKSFQQLEKSPQRTFPIWVKRDGLTASNIMLNELMLIKNIKLKNWELAYKSIKVISTIYPAYRKTHYYRGIVNYKTKKYQGAERDLENYISYQKVKRIYDPSEIAEMLLAYTDSIYQVGNTKKYKKAAKAILNDTKGFGSKNIFIQEVKERISYLLIEILAAENSISSRVEIISEIKKFFKKYTKTTYAGRLRYLLGLGFVDGNNEKEGVKVFNEILKDKDVSDYIKEMVKSELSLINIKNKTI
ncbi:MAG: hypothetical protein HN576_10550 [Bacteriovoracaceae bacterium]|jgi:Tfp pilus assembly protein PilF|nr:hypothetical protein [Bacteriovoracaceae bacterium]